MFALKKQKLRTIFTKIAKQNVFYKVKNSKVYRGVSIYICNIYIYLSTYIYRDIGTMTK